MTQVDGALEQWGELNDLADSLAVEHTTGRSSVHDLRDHLAAEQAILGK
jgi:hypothetical protein